MTAMLTCSLQGGTIRLVGCGGQQKYTTHINIICIVLDEYTERFINTICCICFKYEAKISTMLLNSMRSLIFQ